MCFLCLYICEKMEIPFDEAIYNLSSYYGIDKLCLTHDYYSTIPYWQRNKHNFLNTVEDYNKIINNLKDNITNIEGYGESDDIKWELKGMEETLSILEGEVDLMMGFTKIEKEDLMFRHFCVAAFL